MPASVLRDELVRRVAGRLELSEGRLASLIADGRAAVATQRTGASRHAGRTHRRSIRAPVPSAPSWPCASPCPPRARRPCAAIDPEEHITSASLRRAARHLTGRTAAPLTDLPPEDEELARTVADLVARAGRTPDVSADRLEHARLLLELGRIDRAIRRARGERGLDVGALAREREQVQASIHDVTVRIEGVE